MAAKNSPQALPAAAEGAVPLDCSDHIIAAGGMETALAADDWAERVLIKAHQSNES
jgi:hypothetical protein